MNKATTQIINILSACGCKPGVATSGKTTTIKINAPIVSENKIKGDQNNEK